MGEPSPAGMAAEGEYDGDVGEYEGDVGEYDGEVGEYDGDVGEYDWGPFVGEPGE